MNKYYINITNKCDYSCPFCCMYSSPKNDGFMSFNTLYDIIEKINTPTVVSDDDYGQNGYVVPNLEGPTKPIKGTFRVDEGKYFGEYCKISGCYATLWDGNPEEFYTD